MQSVKYLQYDLACYLHNTGLQMQSVKWALSTLSSIMRITPLSAQSVLKFTKLQRQQAAALE